MERGALFLPPANPGHLAFGIVDAVEEEFLFHFLFGEHLSEVSRDPPVLESEGIEAIPRNAASVKSLHLADHALGKTRVETRFYLFVQNGFGRTQGNEQRMRNGE